jgi:hypothetical protein
MLYGYHYVLVTIEPAVCRGYQLKTKNYANRKNELNECAVVVRLIQSFWGCGILATKTIVTTAN